MEDTSSSWPFPIETGGLKESVTLLEKEMVINKLLSISFRHGSKSVVSTLEISFEFVQSGHNVMLDLVSLIFRDSWSKREISEVSADSDTCGEDVAFLLSSKFWAVQFGVIHVANVVIVLFVSMVILDDLIK